MKEGIVYIQIHTNTTQSSNKTLKTLESSVHKRLIDTAQTKPTAPTMRRKRSTTKQSVSKKLTSGGVEGSRTPDLDDANVALYQLSYDPKLSLSRSFFVHNVY